MVASAGGKDILIAYQMVGPNVERLAKLVDRYPETEFSTVVDHPDAIAAISDRFAESMRNPHALMIDVDCGMHRTGIELGPALDWLRDRIESTPGVRYAGLHVYDGHLHEPSLEERQIKVGGDHCVGAAVRSQASFPAHCRWRLANVCLMGPGNLVPGNLEPGNVEPGNVEPGNVEPGNPGPGHALAMQSWNARVLGCRLRHVLS